MLARERLVVYAQLARIDKPIGTLLLLWPTLWGLWLAGAGQPNLWIVLIFIAGTFLMRSAGCVINDYADRHFDGAVERTKHRPFARGAVSEREALLLAAGLAAIAFLLVLPLNQLTWLMSIPAVVLAASYPFTKRFFPLPQAYLGIAFGFGIPMAFAALNNEVPLLAWQLLIANVFWTLAYDTEYAMCDKPDDLKIGIKTSAITFGHYDVFAVMVCHVMFLGIMAAIAAQQGLGVWFIASLCAAAVLMTKQYQTIRHRERMACFKAFLDNNKVGLVIFVGLVADFALR
jgi:4-hydroxybenzoate polyprenyltransferase